MEVLLNGFWDYHRKGFYVNERHAPLRYRARRFLEKRVIPAARKIGLALKVAAVAALVAMLTLFEKAGEKAEEMGDKLDSLSFQGIAKRIVRETTWWTREPWEKLLAAVIFTIPALAVFFGVVVASFLVVGFFLLMGQVAKRGLAFYDCKER